MLNDKQVLEKANKYKTDTSIMQNTGTKILVWDTEFVFEANKLGEFWYVKIAKEILNV